MTVMNRFPLYCILLSIAICSSIASHASPASAIESVLNSCAAHTRLVNDKQMSAANAAKYLSGEMQKMDTRACPPEFRLAFQQHINAWRDGSTLFARDKTLRSFLEGLAAGYFRDASLFGQAHRKAKAAVEQINQTYNQLSSIAAAYGARVPESTVYAK